MGQQLKQLLAENWIIALVADRDLTLPVAATPDLDPIVAIQAFYVMAAQLSAARGMDPDAPRHLSKVTKTN